MKQFAFLLVVVVYCLFLAGCSYIARFGVVNRSGEALEIEYTLTPNAGSPDDGRVAPFKMAIEDFDSWNGQTNWRRLQPDEYVYDQATRRVRITLRPDEAVQIAEEPANGEDQYKDFKIAALQIKGVHGTIAFEGADFYRQFGKEGFDYFAAYH